MKMNRKYFTLITLIAAVMLLSVIFYQKSQSEFQESNLASLPVSKPFNQDFNNYNLSLKITQMEKVIAEFKVALADSNDKKSYGLMNLENLPQQFGMLFPFDQEIVVTMWMKNTKIPLDMLFIDRNNVITNIKTNAVPMSLDLISSEQKVVKVLEVNAGLVEKFGIKRGDKIKLD